MEAIFLLFTCQVLVDESKQDAGSCKIQRTYDTRLLPKYQRDTIDHYNKRKDRFLL